MRTALIKMGERDGEGYREEEPTFAQAHARKMILLSLKKPAKVNKVDIRQLFDHDRKPIFSFAHAPQQSPPKLSESQKAVEFNIRNLISRSVPQVSREGEGGKGKTQRDFRIVKEKMVKSIRNVGLQKMKQDFLSITQQLGMIANLKEQYPGGKEVKSHKNRHYINNFMKARVQRVAREEPTGRYRRERMEKIEIYPWEKSFETEEDNFMQN